MRKLNSTQRLFGNVILGGIFIIFGLWIVTSLLNPEQTKAAWWNDSWRYRQSVTATNTSPFAAANIPYRILIDTASLITSGKMKADGSDIRIVNNKGKAVRFQIEQSTLNTTQTGIWFDATVQSDNKAVYFIYYGNNQAQAVTFPSDIASNVSSGTTVTTKDGFEYSTSTAYGRISDIKKDGTNLGVNGAYRNTTGYPGNWWDDRTFTRTQLAAGPMFVEIKFEDTGYGDYSSFGTIIKMFKNGFIENQVYLNYNASGSDTLYYYLNYDNGTRNSVWVNGSGTLVDQGPNSGALNRAALGDNWFGQRWTDTGNYGGTIISPITSDWNSAQTSAQDSYYQTNYSTNEAYTPGSTRKIRFGTFAGTGTVDQMHEKASLLGAQSVTLGGEESSPGPVGYWSMDEGSGNLVHDKTGTGSNGTISGATWEPASRCKVGKCLYFDGTNDYVDFGNISSRASISGDLTISFWAKPTNITKGRQNPLGKAYGGEFDFTLETSGSLSYYHGSAGNDAAPYTSFGTNSNTLVNNTWAHVVLVRDTSTRTISYYVNGRRIKSQTYSSTYDPVASTRSFKFGYEYAGYFQGYLDEVIIFSTAKTQSEINALYSAGNAGVAAVKGISVSAGADNLSTLSQGLVGYWKMDETSWNGTTDEVVDSSGSGNDGTASGAVASSAAKFGSSGFFDGTNDVITTDGVDTSSGDFTLAAWIYRTEDSASWKHIFGAESTGYALGLDGTNKLRLTRVSRSDATSSNYTPPLNTWTHISVTYKDSTDQLIYYANGNPIATVTYSGTAPDAGAKTRYIGRSPNYTSWFPGLIDEARIYNRALSGSDIQQLYNFAPGPVAYYSFEEASGTTINDNSGHGNTATLTSSFTQGKYGKGLRTTNNGKGAVLTTSLPFNNQSFTWSTWVKSNDKDGSQSRIMGTSFTSGGYCYVNFGNGNAGLECRDSDGNYASQSQSSKNIADNQWHYVTTIVDRANNKAMIYIDGILIKSGSVSLTGTFGQSTDISKLLFGYQSASSTLSLDGSLDEVRMYNYVRTQAQIIQDMNASHPLGGSPVGSQALYYKFDEGYGTVAHDSAPSPANGTLTCGGAGCVLPEWKQDGKFGKALYFNSSDTANNPTVTISSSTYTKIRTLGDVTISAWINPSSSYADTSQAILREGQGADQEYSLYYNPTTKTISFSWYDGSFKGVSAPSNLVPMNSWSYVAAVRSGTTVYFYVNGKQVGSSTVTAPTVNAAQLSIGRTNNTGVPQDFSGYIDELKVYTAALSAENIRIDYNRGSSLSLATLGTSSNGTASSSAGAVYCVPGDTSSCAAPVAEWNFEEHRGTTINDISGSGNTGTLTNSPVWTQGKHGTGLNFLASNSYVSTTGISIGSTWTMSVWTKFPLASNGSYRTLIRNGSNIHHILVDSSGLLGTYNSSFASSGYDVDSLSGWHHLTAVGTGGSTLFYIDGSYVGTSSQQTTSTITQVGGIGSGQNWGAPVDDFRVYNYVRTPAQIAYDYNRGAPLARWKMDECQGSVIHDVSGNGLNGTLSVGGSGTQASIGTCATSSTAWGNGATGKFNSSLNFDGTDDYVTVGDPAALDITTNDFTLSAWVKTTSTNQQRIISKRDGSTVGYEMLLLSTGKIDFLIGDSGGFTFSNLNNTAVNDGQWHLITLVFDRDANVTSYIDGRRDDAVSISSRTGSLANSADVYIGRYSPGPSQFFDGQIDDVQIFNYALTSTQIHNLVNQNSSVRYGPSQGTP
jgi:hypothetical protein